MGLLSGSSRILIPSGGGFNTTSPVDGWGIICPHISSKKAESFWRNSVLDSLRTHTSVNGPRRQAIIDAQTVLSSTEGAAFGRSRRLGPQTVESASTDILLTEELTRIWARVKRRKVRSDWLISGSSRSILFGGRTKDAYKSGIRKMQGLNRTYSTAIYALLFKICYHSIWRGKRLHLAYQRVLLICICALMSIRLPLKSRKSPSFIGEDN